MLSGKLEFDLHSVLLHAGRVKLILVQAVKVQGLGEGKIRLQVVFSFVCCMCH